MQIPVMTERKRFIGIVNYENGVYSFFKDGKTFEFSDKVTCFNSLCKAKGVNYKFKEEAGCPKAIDATPKIELHVIISYINQAGLTALNEEGKIKVFGKALARVKIAKKLNLKFRHTKEFSLMWQRT